MWNPNSHRLNTVDKVWVWWGSDCLTDASRVEWLIEMRGAITYILSLCRIVKIFIKRSLWSTFQMSGIHCRSISWYVWDLAQISVVGIPAFFNNRASTNMHLIRSTIGRIVVIDRLAIDHCFVYPSWILSAKVDISQVYAELLRLIREIWKWPSGNICVTNDWVHSFVIAKVFVSCHISDSKGLTCGIFSFNPPNSMVWPIIVSSSQLYQVWRVIMTWNSSWRTASSVEWYVEVIAITGISWFKSPLPILIPISS